MDDYKSRSYGAHEIGMKGKLGIVVVDFQVAFTDKKYPLGGAPLIMRGVDNTERLLEVARSHGIPVASCYTGYTSSRDMPYWKVDAVCKEFLHDHPGSAIEPRLLDKDYDLVTPKHGPSIFFQTPVVPYFIKEGVQTVIVTGCTTSGCIRASTIDCFSWGFRTIVPEDCVGDHEEGPHRDNLRDVGRRYADISTADKVIEYIKGTVR